jgi:organic radical activating enzyme
MADDPGTIHGSGAPAGRRLKGDASHPDHRRYLEAICQNDPQIFIELSSICNFQCFYCESPNHGRKSQMDDETFHRVVEQVCRMTTQPIRLHCDGEPTVHAKFYDYASAVNARGRRISLVSNGSNLQKRFLDLKMDVGIHLSTSADEFKRRSSLSFERYLAGMSEYLACWIASPSEQNIFYNIYLTSSDRDSAQEMNRIRQFANDFLDSVGLRRGVTFDAAPNTNWYAHRKGNGFRFRLGAKNIASGGMYPEVEAKKIVTLPRDFGFCDSPWKRLVILSDGSLQPCCLDLKGTLAYAQPDEVRWKSLHDLWHNDPRINGIREEMLRGEINHPTCQKCLDRLPGREFYTAFAEKFRPASTGKSGQPEPLQVGALPG